MPGAAQLRILQGDPEAAEQLLQDALTQAYDRPLARARLLPSLIDAGLALDHYPLVHEALAELEGACENNRVDSDAVFGSPRARISRS